MPSASGRISSSASSIKRPHCDRLRRDRERPFLDAGQVEYLVDDREQVVTPLEDHRHLLLVLLLEVREPEELAEPHDRRERRAQLVTHLREKLVFRRVGRAQPGVRVLQFDRPPENLAFHHRRALLQFVRQRLLAALALLQPDELGHVLDAMDDVPEPFVVVQHGRVPRAPVPLLEAAAALLRPADVVLLHGHRVGNAALAHALERRAQVADPGRLVVVRVVREHVEDAAAGDLVALRHRRVEVRVADRDDAKVGVEHQVETGAGLEERTKVGRVPVRHRREAYDSAAKSGSRILAIRPR